MALHKVEGRLNRLDRLPQEAATAGTTSVSNKVDGAASTGYVVTKDATIRVNDGTVNRILIGFLPDGTWGIVVSKPGIDVLTAF